MQALAEYVLCTVEKNFVKSVYGVFFITVLVDTSLLL